MKTEARGHFLVVDPVNASALFTAIQPAKEEEEILIKDLPDGRIKIYFDRWGTRAFILKYAIDDETLKLVSSQKNAAGQRYTLAITPDGKKVLMTSGGGWRPPVEGGTGGDYVCAAFSTENLETRLGETRAANNMAFHPVLNLGVLNQGGRDLQLFNPKSMVAGKTYNVAKGADGRPLLLTFGGKGTKIILWNGDNPANKVEGLHFLSLEQSAQDRAVLEKVYGKLPDPVIAKPDPKPTAMPAAAPAPVAPAVAAPAAIAPRTIAPTTTAPKPTATVTTAPKAIAPAVVDAGPLPAGVIAISGFNNLTGLNSTKAVDAPYPLGKSNVSGGLGERGWLGDWPANPKVTFVKDVVAEGDGAVHLLPTVNYGRMWSQAQQGKNLPSKSWSAAPRGVDANAISGKKMAIQLARSGPSATANLRRSMEMAADLENGRRFPNANPIPGIRSN